MNNPLHHLSSIHEFVWTDRELEKLFASDVSLWRCQRIYVNVFHIKICGNCVSFVLKVQH